MQEPRRFLSQCSYFICSKRSTQSSVRSNLAISWIKQQFIRVNMEFKTLLVLTVISLVKCNDVSQCSSSPETDMAFSVSSYRNQTGHWVAQVMLEHEDSPGNPGYDHSNKGTWHVDVKQVIKKCNGVQTVQIITTLTGPPSASPAGYEYFPGVGYYKFHKNPKTWDEARKICEQEGAHLAVINSEQESNVIQQYLAAAPHLENANNNDYAFVGFHDRFVEGDYITVFGTSLGSTGFTRWAGPGQPDNAGGNENCGSVYRNGGLNDIPCNWKLAFFCEQEPW